MAGLWNPHWRNKHSWRYVAYLGYALFMVFVLTLHTVTLVLELYFSWGDFTNFGDIAWSVSNFAATIIKQIFILAQTDRVR
jgi:hypothetical protein